MLLTILLLVASIFLIWRGSDWLTDSLIPVANRFGTNYIAVTTLLASFMMSTPEIVSSVSAYLSGHLNIGLGVIIGSVIINIGLTVGLSAAYKPLSVEKGIVVRDGLFLIIVTIIVMVLGSDLKYDTPEGIVLLLLFIPYALNVWYFEKARSEHKRKEKLESISQNLDMIGEHSFLKLPPSLLTFVLGAIVMIFGSYLFSNGLIMLSAKLALPEIIVGIFFGGIGVGTPNIAAALQGTRKGFKDVALTETFGSNIFTLLVTLGINILLSPLLISAKVFYFNLVWMIAIHVLMLAFILKGYRYREASLTRLEGIILVIFYFAIIIMDLVIYK